MKPYALIWQPPAVAGLIRLRSADAQAARAVRTAVSSLAENAEPSSSTPLGSGSLRRLRVADARILYEVDHTHRAVHILTVGQVRR